MRRKDLERARTGHLDGCGEMICRKDRVTTKDGTGRVAWACGKWWIVYPGRRAVALNDYPAEAIRRESESVTIDVVTPFVTESIVTEPQNHCHTDCHGFVTEPIRSESVGYIKSVTV